MVIKNISVAGSHDFNNSKKELSDQFVKNELERVQDLMKQDKFTGGDKINKKLWPKNISLNIILTIYGVIGLAGIIAYSTL